MASNAQTIKQQAHELIDRMPNDCTAEDIQYELYLLEKIRRAENSLRRDGGIPHEEVRRRAAKWAQK